MIPTRSARRTIYKCTSVRDEWQYDQAQTQENIKRGWLMHYWRNWAALYLTIAGKIHTTSNVRKTRSKLHIPSSFIFRHTYETNNKRVSTRQRNGKRMTESTSKRKCKLCNDTNNGNGYTGDSRVACQQLSLRSWWVCLNSAEEMSAGRIWQP